MVRRRITARLGATVLALAAAGPLAAQEPPPGYAQGVHIVRPGETLIGITRKYLGSGDRWADNHRLNPQIADPHRLTPGERIRVLLPAEPRVPTARVRKLAGRVENRPAPIPWDPARRDDLLLERDGQRTFSRSSSELEFPDGTRVVLTEESLVFFRRTGAGLAAEPQPRSVEIVEGQADLEARGLPPGGAPVEVLIGGTRAVSQVDESGKAQTRARRSTEGSAQLMVYEGAGEVEAAGQRVAVARGMGTSAGPGGPPAPPEELLPGPQTLRPAPGSRWDFNQPRLYWREVPGAVSYTVEVCRDAGCGELVQRRLGLTGTSWEPEPLPVADLFWRSTAVSPSGLDGYPSTAVPFSVLSDQGDVTPPTGALSLVGRQTRVDRTLYADDEVEVQVQLSDAQSGVEKSVPLINEVERPDFQLAGPWDPGPYRVSVRATDRAGNTGDLPAIEFVVDGAGPGIEWRAGPWDPRPDLSPVPPRKRRRWLRRGAAWLEWSVDALNWHLLVLEPGPPKMARFLERHPRLAADDFMVGSERPQLLLRAMADRPLTVGEHTLDPGDLLRITALDDGSGVWKLAVALRRGEGQAGGRLGRLELTSTDALGNEYRLALPIGG